jgi:Mg-chelatase subunit ChlD
MSEYRLDFVSPWWLLLLAVLPVLWWLSFRSLAGLGRWRRLLALALRSLVLLLIVAALAEMQLVRRSEDLTVLYLLDYSLSVSNQQSSEMLKYVNESIRKHRAQHPKDRAGVIVFGRTAEIEIPPLDEDQSVRAIETMVDRQATNLAAAMKMAEASFPHDTAKRIVILTDGNETTGVALQQARSLVDAGIGIDVVPIRSSASGEVAVEKIAMPSDVRRGEPFELRVVLNNTTPAGENGGNVRGKLIVARKTGNHEEVFAEQEVELPPGKRVFAIPETIELPDFYTYEARFVPADPASDGMPQNNSATTFTHVRGSGQVLLLEDFENPGEHDLFVERLRAMNLEVTVRETRPELLFNDLGELQPFDTVIMANVPREQFTDAQIDVLVRNTQNMGAGLVMLGGPNSLGPGGWTNTPIETAMPVEFQIKNTKVAMVGALALLMHASEIPQGNYWQKVVAAEAIKTLGNQDYCGLLHWGDMGGDSWLWGQPQGIVKVGGNRGQMLARLDRMTPGDMPQFDPAMIMATKAFSQLTAKNQVAVKHMIIISDGDPSPPSGTTITNLKNLNVKISTVAIGAHGPAESAVLRNIASATGGKYYAVNNANALPRIYQQEARRVAQPLIFRNEQGFSPRIKYPHEMTKGIDEVLPPITGFVLTTVKDSPLVEISLQSPVPPKPENATILASWTYGLGRTAVLTTDVGKRWAAPWTGWEGYDKLFSQLVRWSMRPVGDTGKFTVNTDVQDGKVRVVVTALDQNDEFLNFLNLSGSVVAPDMKSLNLEMKQTAPGRYVGEVDATQTGSYFVMLSPGAGQSPIRAGVSIPYSAEFRERETNEALLKSLAGLAPKSAEPGKVIDAEPELPTEQRLAKLLEADTFRHDLPKAASSQDVWHLLVFAASCIFLGDVFVRRVTLSFDWMSPLLAKLRRRQVATQTATMERLRSRKEEVGQQLEERRAATRYEPRPDEPVEAADIDQQLDLAKPTRQEPTKKTETLTPQGEQETYTDRLLKAKRKVWEERNKDK